MNQLEEPILDSNTIEAMLPHRQPMVLVDSLLFYSENKGVAGYTIKENSMFLEGGSFTEAGLIEHMAQTAALHAGYASQLKKDGVKEGFIAAIKSCHIHELPKLGSTLTTEITIVYQTELMSSVECECRSNGEICVTATMTTVLNSKE